MITSWRKKAKHCFKGELLLFHGWISSHVTPNVIGRVKKDLFDSVLGYSQSRCQFHSHVISLLSLSVMTQNTRMSARVDIERANT